MRTTTAALLSLLALACSNPVELERSLPLDPSTNITTQARPVPSLVIELVGGDCNTGITVRVRGENLSARSRFGNQWLNKTNLTSFGPAQVELGAGNKKVVEWTVFWPASTINPASGAKFNGYAKGVVTDNWTGWLHETPVTQIAPACQ